MDRYAIFVDAGYFFAAGAKAAFPSEYDGPLIAASTFGHLCRTWKK
ncbi:MAG: hypothetical protein LBU76_09320 [Azoarcus sp.]|jgi:hypothetical protein|nr:hypothetical protein [Azoarcus sp.]